jgi:CheY-like chemotaxis protein
LLETLECPARIVSNGLEALEMMRSEEFDLALLDCEMPGLDGYEVTARVRKMGGKHIPIVAMTASAMSADRQRCFDAGMDDLLAKPFGKVALNDMLTKWLTPRPTNGTRAPLAQEVAMRPELDSEVFEELRQSLNWQVPKLRRIYQSIRESAQKTIGTLGGGVPPDLELAQRQLHSLQGGAGLVGARQIEHVAARMGQALRERRGTQEIFDGLPLLLDVLRRFELVLERRIDALSA